MLLLLRKTQVLQRTINKEQERLTKKMKKRKKNWFSLETKEELLEAFKYTGYILMFSMLLFLICISMGV